jgi:hypothetical protein
MPAADAASSVSKRRSRVSSRLAETTQSMAVRRYDGRSADQCDQAAGFARRRASHSGELLRGALVRVDRVLAAVALLEGADAGRAHPPCGPELGNLGDVDRAPARCPATRREPVRPHLVVDPVADPVDPPEAERLDDGLRVGHRGLRDAFLPVADPQLGGGVVVLLQPGPELVGGAEDPHLLAGRAADRAHQPPASRMSRCRTRPATARR